MRAVACCALLLSTLHCAAPAPSEPVLPEPDLARLSEEAAARVREAREALRATLDDAAAAPSARATRYGELGRVALAAELNGLAEACFRAAEAAQPHAFEWPYYLGHLHRGQGDYAAATAAFRRALTHAPDEIPALAWLGRTLLDNGDLEGAAARFERIDALDPGSAVAQYHLGKIALERGDAAQAAERIERALASVPGASIMHYSLALAYRQLGRLDDAERHLALRGETDIYPVDPWMDRLRTSLSKRAALLERAGRLYTDGRLQQAEEIYREGLATLGDDAGLYSSLGSTLLRLERLDEALRAYERAAELAPDSPAAHYGIGAVLERQGDDAGALRRFRTSLELAPGFPAAHLRLGHIARRGGAFARAVEHYRSVLAVDPLHAEARFGEAISFVGAGDFAAARDRFEEATERLPEQPAFAHALARLLVAAPDATVRDAPRALALLNQLQQVDQSVELALTIAMALAEGGRFEEALGWQERSIAAWRREAGEAGLQPLLDNLERYRAGRPCRTPWPADAEVFRPSREAGPAPIERAGS